MTGKLRLDDQNRVHRGLDWAQIRNGQPNGL
jgi:outer membrane PBP1 activator LpoA protein